MMGVENGMRMRPSLLVAVIYGTVAFLLFGNTIDAKFADDFYGWLRNYQDDGFRGLLRCFDYSSSLYVYHGLTFGLYKIFGLQSWPWFIIFTGLHVANAFLLFRFSHKILARFNIDNATLISFTAGMLFLVSPKHGEPVIWAATIHYLVSCLLILSMLLCILRFHDTQQRRYHYLGLACGFISVFTLEVAQMLPVVMLLFYIFVVQQQGIGNIKRFLLNWVIPQIAFGISFFTVNYLRTGDWVGHYGPEVHLKFSIPNLVGNALTYFIDYLIFLKQLPYRLIEAITNFLDTPWFGYMFFILALITLILIIIKFRKLNARTRLILLSASLFFVLVAPVLNLYYFFIIPGVNDRFGYVPSPFLYLGVALLCFSILSRKWAVGVLVVYFAIALFISNNTTIQWQKTGILRNGLLESYEPFEADSTVLLNIPNFLQGGFIFRHFNTFPVSYKTTRGHDIRDKTWEIASYNMTKLTNGVDVVQRDSNQVQVTFDHYGSWWWRNGKGALDYETEHYKVDFDEWSHSYLLTFTDTLYKNRTLLYQDGNKWQEFEMN